MMKARDELAASPGDASPIGTPSKVAPPSSEQAQQVPESPAMPQRLPRKDVGAGAGSDDSGSEERGVTEI